MLGSVARDRVGVHGPFKVPVLLLKRRAGEEPHSVLVPLLCRPAGCVITEDEQADRMDWTTAR